MCICIYVCKLCPVLQAGSTICWVAGEHFSCTMLAGFIAVFKLVSICYSKTTRLLEIVPFEIWTMGVRALSLSLYIYIFTYV